MNTITKGYKPAHLLQEEISSLENKAEILQLPLEQSQSGFNSKYFLAPKKERGLRPILNLEKLHETLSVYNFEIHDSDKLCTSGTLVYIHRFKGCFFTSPFMHLTVIISCLPSNTSCMNFWCCRCFYTEASIAPLIGEGMCLVTLCNR